MSAGFEDHFDRHGPRPPRREDAHASDQEQEVLFRDRLIDPWNETETVQLLRELGFVFERHFPSYVHSDSFAKELQQLTGTRRAFSNELAEKRDTYFSYELHTDDFKARFSQERMLSQMATGLAYLAEGEPEAAHLAFIQVSELFCALAEHNAFSAGKYEGKEDRHAKEHAARAARLMSGSIAEALYDRKAEVDFGVQIALEGYARVEGMVENLMKNRKEQLLLQLIQEELTVCVTELCSSEEPADRFLKLIEQACGVFDVASLEFCCIQAFHLKTAAKDTSLARSACANSILRLGLQRLERSGEWESERRDVLLESLSRLHGDRDKLLRFVPAEAFERSEREFWSPVSVIRSVVATRQLASEQRLSLSTLMAGEEFKASDHSESLLSRNQCLYEIIQKLEPAVQ